VDLFDLHVHRSLVLRRNYKPLSRLREREGPIA
jgi:hypothetical protein